VNIESDKKKCSDDILFHAEKIIVCFFLDVFFELYFVSLFLLILAS